MKRNFYSFKKCHFCKLKLDKKFNTFALITDSYCKDKDCHNKYRYYTSYDDKEQYYYECSFNYKNYYFRFFFNKENEFYKLQISDSNQYINTYEMWKLSSDKDLEIAINRFKNLVLLK